MGAPSLLPRTNIQKYTEGLNIPAHTAYYSILIVPASKCIIWEEAAGFIFSRQEKHISKQVLAQLVQSAPARFPEKLHHDISCWTQSKSHALIMFPALEGNSSRSRQVQDKLHSRILLLLSLTIPTVVERKEKRDQGLNNLLTFGSDYQHEERKTTFQSISTEMLLSLSCH